MDKHSDPDAATDARHDDAGGDKGPVDSAPGGPDTTDGDGRPVDNPSG